MRKLQRGMRGPDVERWQQFLIAQGLLPSAADGVFGARTEAATLVFQAREGLAVDGVVTVFTIANATQHGFVPLRRVREHDLPTAVLDAASELLQQHWDRPYGTALPLRVGDRKFVARLEQQYHPPGSAFRPWGYHPSIALFESAEGTLDQILLDDETEFNPSTRPMLDGLGAVGQASGVAHGRFQLSDQCRSRLKGVHADLRRLVERCIAVTTLDFCVLEGVRSLERQRELYAVGATRVLNSRHLTGHAVDLAPWVGAAASWHWPHFQRLAEVVKRVARELGVTVEWGGDWERNPDGPHWELNRSDYPGT